MVDWSKAQKPGKDLLDLCGNTPMVRLNRVTAATYTEIYAKLEYFNPSGSLKDRILFHIVREAEDRGELRPGMTLIEGTTGNTGIATAMAGAVRGYPVMIVMPRGMSEERQKAIRAYGAELVLTDGGESDVDLVLERVAEIKAAEPARFFEVGQFSNQDNIEAHYQTTGPEIWEQTEGQVDIFVASQGTGGTITGVTRYLKERRPEVKSFAVEPAECPVISKGQWGSHEIEGIGDGFVPDNLDLGLLDGVVTVTSAEATEMARRLAREEGIFCGISSGCNVAAALKVAGQFPEARTVVTMINDNGLRYFSTRLCGEEPEIDIPERDHPLDERTVREIERRRAAGNWKVIT